jgi:oligosaccharide repeat unit polymerase
MYSAAWFIVLFFYELGWSVKYPDISFDLYTFLIITSSITLLLALYCLKYRVLVYKPLENPLRFYPWIMTQVKRVYILLAIECLGCRSIPLLSYALGKSNDSDYMDFGLPFVHVIVLNALLLLFYFSTYCHFSIIDNNKFLRPMLITLCGPLLFMSRGSVMYMLFGLFFIYLMASRKAPKTMIKLFPCSLLVLYSFGALGNFRTGDSEIFLTWGGATEEFKESVVPDEFFWSYSYLTSPLGNLQNSITYKKVYKKRYSGFTPLLANCILPRFIGKRLNIPKPPDLEDYYVDPTLVVGSTYYVPYLTWGWKGIIIVYVCILGTLIIMIKIIPKYSVFRVPMIVVLSNLAFFSLFDNMLTYMGLFPQLAFIYMLRNLGKFGSQPSIRKLLFFKYIRNKVNDLPLTNVIK